MGITSFEVLANIIITYTIILGILMFVLFTGILLFISRKFKFKKHDLKTALIVSGIVVGGSALLNVILKKASLLITLLISIFTIKYIYKEKWKSSIFAAIATYFLTVMAIMGFIYLFSFFIS